MVEKCLSSRQLLRCGVQSGFQEEAEGGLCLKEGEASAVFISRTYDSGRNQMEWGRALLEISRNVTVQIYVWLFDEKQEEDALQEFCDVREQFLYIRGCAQYHSNYRELPLCGEEYGKGRFAKLAVEVFSGEGAGRFTGYSLTFPKESFTRYLPEIYRNNDWLERFLAVQQSIYLELEEKIDTFAEELDYEWCGEKQAAQLLTWMGWGELAGQLKEETARKLLREGISLISRKGTCEYYIRLTEILTGKKAVMLEEAEKGQATVVVLEKPEGSRERYLEWLRQNVPLFAKIDFVVLGRTEHLDGRYFLDVNAFLSEKESELMEDGICIERLMLL